MGLTCSLSRRRQSTLIHRLQMFRDRFSEGSLYSMSGFDEVTTTSKFECAADRDVFICLSLFDGLAYEFHLKKLHVLVPNQALL